MADNNSYKQTPRRRGPGGGMAPAEKAKNFKGSISKLMQYIGRYKIAILAVMIMAAASTVFTVIGPKVLGKATTGLSEGLMKKITGTGGIDFSYIGRILIIVLCLYACSAIFSFIQGWIMTGVSQKVCYRLRKEISEKINRMPMKYFESRTYGEVLSRITNDVDTLGMGLNQSITTIITSVATMIGVLVMMLSISPLMTIIAIVILPISVGLVSFVVKKSQSYFKTQQEYLGHINGQIEETYGGHMVVKSFNKEKDMVDTFDKTNAVLYSSAWKSQFFSGMMQPIMMFVGNLGYAGVALSGGMLAINGVITIGDIQAFIQYVKNFTQPITQIAQVINQVQSMAAASERVFEFLEEEEEEQIAANPVPTDNIRGEVRDAFGMVLQDTWLYKDTIMENIRYGKLDATDEEVIAAAKAAHAHHFIETLPGGYNMELNEDASNVSQGQKQLLTIARAILADNPILILDEATSSVDTRTEIQIQNAMDNLMKGRTSFVIAHRLSTIKDADIILVMKEGDIVEQGNHEELLAKGGFYADLYNSQFEEAEAS